MGDLLVEELIEESADSDLTKGLTIEKPVEELIEELVEPLSIEEVIEYIRRAYLSNNIVQRIIVSKVVGY